MEDLHKTRTLRSLYVKLIIGIQMKTLKYVATREQFGTQPPRQFPPLINLSLH